MTPYRPSKLPPALLLGLCLLGCASTAPDKPTPAIAGASNASIHILYDQSAPLPTRGSYGWGLSLLRVDPRHGIKLSEVQARMHQALAETLATEGFVPSDESPDYLVSFAFLDGEAMDEAELNEAYGALLSFPARKHSAPSLRYERGVLIVDIVDRAKTRLLWRGALKADLDLSLPEDQKQQRCDEAVRELFRHYPSAPRQ